MINRLADPKHTTIRKPSSDVISILRQLISSDNKLCVAEIGVGVGATTREIYSIVGNSGHIHLFDFGDTLRALQRELESEDIKNITIYPNTRKKFDSYNWSLANLLKNQRSKGKAEIFDFVYLDGAHSFHHDAPAAVILKELVKKNGVILFDDYLWSFAASPTANPNVNKSTGDDYTEEQINKPHVALICDLFFDHDSNFEKLDLGYERVESRRAYRKK